MATVSAHKNECLAGSGLSMATSHESERQPAFTCTVPVIELSLSFLQDIKESRKIRTKKWPFCMVVFSADNPGMIFVASSS